MAALTPVLTGLGLFFCGARFVASNLAQLAGSSARQLFRRALSSRWLAALSGILAGLLTQSTNAVALIMVSFARTGIVDGRRAVLVPTWSHVGASALVIVVAVDTRLTASYILALAGAAIYFDVKLSDRVRHAVMAVLGAGMLLLGLEMLRVSSGPLRSVLVSHGVLQPGSAPGVTLLIGLALAVITQSSTVACAVAVALVRVGVFDLDTALLMLTAANGGSGLNYAFLARRGEATGRHILFFQAAQKMAGTVALFAPLAAAPRLLNTAILDIPLDTAGRLAWVFLTMQILGSLTCTLLHEPLSALLARIAPATHQDELGKPAFLVDEALDDPPLALDLAEREGLRLHQRLPLMLEHLRADGDRTAPGPSLLLGAGVAVGEAVRRYLAAVLDRPSDHTVVLRAMRLQQAVTTTVALHETLAEFVHAADQAAAAAGAKPTVGRMIESLHMLLGVLADAAASRDAEDRALALTLFRQREELMEDLRSRLLAQDPNTPVKVQEALFQTTVLFERVLWLGRDSLQAMMREDSGGSARTDPAGPIARPAAVGR